MGKYTTTTVFLSPTIDVNFQKLIRFGFENAYLGDHGHTVQHLEHLYFLFNVPKFTAEYTNFEHELRSHHQYEDDYDVAKGKVMFVFKVPKRYTHLIQLFKDGKYSKFDKDYVKNKLDENAYKVCTKDESIKTILEEAIGTTLPSTAEVWSIPSAEKEIYRFKDEYFYTWYEDISNAVQRREIEMESGRLPVSGADGEST